MSADERYGPWTLTSKGARFFPLDPRPGDIDIEDIAHALSNVCRFGGHCRTFYSVAQHSVLVSRHVPRRLALHGLLHDASEAYCGDLVRPIKRKCRDYQSIELVIEAVVALRFGLAYITPAEVKAADNRALMTERRDLMPPCPWAWTEDQAADGGVPPWEETIIPVGPEVARAMFLERFAELGGQRATRAGGQ